MRLFGVILAVMIGLLMSSGWMGTSYQTIKQEDTMRYKLKYVRLRPIHEEEWKRFQAKYRRKIESESEEFRRILIEASTQ